MVIQCDACNARYRLDLKLIRGYSAARIRCRRCGVPILVTVAPLPTGRDLPAAPPTLPRTAPRDLIRVVPSPATAQPLSGEERGGVTATDDRVNVHEIRYPGLTCEPDSPTTPAAPGKKRHPSTGGPGILEEPFPWTEEEGKALLKILKIPPSPPADSRRRGITRHRSPGFFGSRITTLGALFASLPVRKFS